MRVVSMLSVLFALFYAAFLGLAPWIHGYSHPPDAENMAPWLRLYAGEHDGAELPAMVALFTLYLAAAYGLISFGHRLPWIPWKPGQWIACLPALWIVLATRSWSFTTLPPRSWKIHLALLLGLVATGATVRLLAAWKAPGGACGKAGAAAFWTALALFIVLASPAPSVHDYLFFLGPAGKILQGEAWGGFYQQYGLGETLFFAGMMKLGWSLSAMQAALGVILAFWIFLYHRLAGRLFGNQAMVLLFLTGLIVLRVLAFRYCPFNQPQTSPLRMDLWVPPLLAWAAFGIASPVTAITFGLIYLFDNLFGMLFCGLYGFALLFGLLIAKDPSLTARKPAGLALLLLPGLLACAFQMALYGSPISPAGRLYKDLHLGFLPIDPHSLFWPIALLLALSLAVLAPGRKLIHLFLFPAAAVQLLYFFGRSHENALLISAGIFVFIFFLALDRLASRTGRPALAYVAACLGIASWVLLFEEGIWSRAAQVGRNLSAGTWVGSPPEEAQVEADPRLPQKFQGRKILFVSPVDAFLYYRYGLPAPGFWMPFIAYHDMDEAAAFLKERVQAGDAAVITGWDSPGILEPLWDNPKLLASGWRLVVKKENGYDVVGLDSVQPDTGTSP